MIIPPIILSLTDYHRQVMYHETRAGQTIKCNLRSLLNKSLARTPPR